MQFLLKYKNLFLFLTASIPYFYFAFFLDRTEFGILVSLWFGLFILSFSLLKSSKLSFKTLAGIAIIFRLIFLFSIPNLSQDFYRFIWDGKMILNGFNPYLSLPEKFIQLGNFPIQNATILYEGMGELNGSHYTNYPPLNQLCFLIATFLGGKSIFATTVFLRLIIILADIGILYFGSKLLRLLQLPVRNIFWYVLNPFIIIEMTGNLHFEPVMLFFLIVALYQLYQKKWMLASFLLACSISIKLIPLLFLPLFLQWFTNEYGTKKGWFKFINFGVKTVIISVLFFLPFYSQSLIDNYSNSVGLWFRNFEFNASFYYIFREIGYLFRGYNEIAVIGKITPILTILFLGYITFFRKNTPLPKLIAAMLFGLCFYYFTATTVHPWYVATPLILCVFTKYRFPIVWTLVIILSYQAYANTPWKENLIWVTIEYLIVFGVLIYELKNVNKKSLFNDFFKL